jgi:hypothetical protein
METPGSGSPSSAEVTVPDTCRVCAFSAKPQKNSSSDKRIAVLFIEIDFRLVYNHLKQSRKQK